MRATLLEGTHASGVRYWVERIPGVDAPFVSVIGNEPGVFHQVEMLGATRRSVEALIDDELARRAKAAAKRVAA